MKTDLDARKKFQKITPTRKNKSNYDPKSEKLQNGLGKKFVNYNCFKKKDSFSNLTRRRTVSWVSQFLFLFGEVKSWIKFESKIEEKIKFKIEEENKEGWVSGFGFGRL